MEFKEELHKKGAALTNWPAACVRPDRTFLKRMIELSTVAKENHYYIRLNRGLRSDLQWWACKVEWS